MEDAEWAEFVDEIEAAKGALQRASLLMDGVEGFTEAGGMAMVAADAAIDAVLAAETAYRESDAPDDEDER